MVGGTRRHNRIARNVLTHFHIRLGSGKCQPYGSDMKVVIAKGNVRFGDVVVDCGVGRPSDLAASEPSVVVEVLSKSTAWLDQTEKLDDYQSIPCMRHILHLAQERAEGELWTLGASGRRRAPLRGLDAEVDLAAIGVKFALNVAYEDVELDPEPALQNDNGDA